MLSNLLKKEFKNIDLLSVGSSLKFCLVAEGKADIYPRFGPTSEWDSAAGQCIVEEAGGKVVTTDGKALLYNTKAVLLNPDFVVLGDWLHLMPLLEKLETKNKH